MHLEILRQIILTFNEINLSVVAFRSRLTFQFNLTQQKLTILRQLF